MGSNLQTFEVRVKVKKSGSKHFSYHVGMYIENETTKTFHKEARTGEQAMQKCEKYGRPISYQKVDVERIRPVENLQKLLEPYGANNPYSNAIAMDEMIWRKKANRSERIEDRKKDKESY